jgi:hypothetical protein
MKRVLFLVTAALLILTSLVTESYAFDIAVYGDARSGVNWNTQGNCSCSRSTMLSHITAGTNQNVFDWYKAMGVTHVQVYYPYADDYTALQGLTLDPSIKIMNFSWPGENTKMRTA